MQAKKYWLLFVIFIFVWVVGAWVYGQKGGPTRPTIPSGVGVTHQILSKNTDWLNTARPLTVEDLRGRIVLLDFWTYCCINCMHVLPDLHRLEKEFGSDLTVIGVHSAKFDNEKESQNIRDAILRYEIEHPVVNDSDFRIWNGFGVDAWPTFVLLEPNGEVFSTHSGEGQYENLRKDILAVQQKYQKQWVKTSLPLQLEKTKQSPQDLNFPGKLEIATEKNLLFISDTNNHRIVAVRLDPLGEVVFEVGRKGEKGWKDGDFGQARFNRPQGLAYQNGILYVADTENHLIRKIDLETKTVTTLAGTGKQGFERDVRRANARETALSSPWDLAFFPDAGHLAIAMAGTHQIWGLDLAKEKISVLAGNGRESIDDGPYPFNSLSQPSGLAAFEAKLYFVDSETSSLRVLEGGQVNTLIGTGLFDFGLKDGVQGVAKLQHPLGIYADASGVYIADSYNHALRRYDPNTKTIRTLKGDGKPGSALGALREPNDLIVWGGQILIADTNNHRVLIGDRNGTSAKVLALNFPATPSKGLAIGLPNLKSSSPQQVKAQVPLQFSLQLEPGWKVNPQAPSRVQLLKVVNGQEEEINHFEKSELALKILSLPALGEAMDYRLRGTIYYCREGQEAICSIQSFDQAIEVRPEGPIAWGLLIK